MFGYSAKEMIEKDLKRLMPLRYWKSHKEAVPNLLSTGQPKHIGTTRELVGLRRDRSEFPMELALSSWKGDGQVRFTGIIRDITEHKRAKEELAFQASILEQVHNGVIAVDLNDKIIYWSNSSEELYQWKSEEVIGKNIVELLAPEAMKSLATNISSTVFREGHWEGEFNVKRKDGSTIPALILSTILKDVNGKKIGRLGISADITERKQAEKDLQYNAAELARSNRELQQFAHAISHDLQEPLRTMSSYVQLLADRYKEQLDAKAHMYIGYIVEGATRMNAQIRGILSLSKVTSEAHKLAPTNCEDVLRNIQVGLQVYIKEQQAQITIDPLPTVRANSAQLGQLFQNLIVNAIKFRGEEPPRVHISAREKDENWLFSIRDNGMGIEPEHGERIFEIFQRLVPREKYPGTGIGLSICKRIVERHGGKIWVESTPGNGSTFCFTIDK